MGRRAFSLVELVIVLSILAVVVPLIWRLVSQGEDQRALALDHLETADEVRTVAAQVGLDTRAGERIGGPLAFRIDGCDVSYVVDATVLRRDAPTCGGSRALARGVESLTRVPSGVDVVFAFALRPNRIDRQTVFIPVPE